MVRTLLALAASFAAFPLLSSAAIAQQAYKWANVKIGGGGGFIPGIVFNPSEKGATSFRVFVIYRSHKDRKA